MNVLGLIVCVAVTLTVCLPEVSSKGQLGEICNADWECKIFGSACFSGYCYCKATHLELDGLCVVEFGKTCSQGVAANICKGTDVACRSPEKDEFGYGTIGATCMCRLNFTLHTPPDTCRAKIGMWCNTTQTDECNDGSCVKLDCKGGLCAGGSCTAELNGKWCMAGDVEGTCVGEECMVDTCIKSTGKCPIGKCNCTEPGLVPTRNNTRCFPDLGKACSGKCADTNAECSKDKVCSCKPSYQNSSSLIWAGECRKSLGMPCNTRQDCAHDSATCIQMSLIGKKKVCVCGPGFVPRQDRSDCLPEAANIESLCEEDLQCQVKLGRKSECKEKKPGEKKKCLCKAKYEWDEDEETCVRA